MMKQRAPKRPAAERKRMILEAAQKVFAESGYANAGAEEVAREAGVSPSAIYRYFPSKRELYLAALRDAGPHLIAIWQAAAGETTNPLEAIWRVGMDYYNHVQTRLPYVRLWFQALSDVADPDVREALSGNFTGMVDLLTVLLASGQKSGVVRADVNPRIIAWHFMSVGLTFDIINVLGLEDELDLPRVEAWGHMFIESIAEGARATVENELHEPGGTLRVRKPRGARLSARGGNPLPPVQEDPSHPVDAGGAGGSG